MIKTLFVIGNGMDIDHGMQTRWTDFFKPDIIEKITKHSEKLRHLFNNDAGEWNDFERSLGALIDIYTSAFVNVDTKKLANAIKINELDIKYIHCELQQHYEKYKNSPCKNNYIINNDLGDITMVLINEMIKHILQIYSENNFEPQEKYVKTFRNFVGERFIVNYNYTTFYYKKYKYFSEDETIHIHGKIDKNKEPYNKIRSDMSTKKDEIKLGLYKFQTEVSTPKLLKKFQNEGKVLSSFQEKIGNRNLYFRKAPLLLSDEEKKFSHLNFSEIEKIIFIGHSLKGNDLPYLKLWVPSFDIEKKFNIKVYDIFDDEESKVTKLKEIKEIFKNTENKITLIDNR